MLQCRSDGPVNCDNGGGGGGGQRGVYVVPRYRPHPVLNVRFDVRDAALMPYVQFNVSGKGGKLG